MQNSLSHPDFQRDLSATCVAIVGVGMMGGSLAASLKTNNRVRSIIGVGRDQEKLECAVQQGLLCKATTSMEDAAALADIIVVCTPVNRIVKDVRNIASNVPVKKPPTLITDVGSVKQKMCEALQQGLPEHVEFLGSHPIAGSEKTGFENAIPNLFQGRRTVITPVDTTSEFALTQIRNLWQTVGSEVVETTPQLHDEILGRTSHLPHIVAAALTATLKTDDLPFTATGFQDTSRIASGDPTMWTAILEGNKEHLVSALVQMEQALVTYRSAIEDEDSEKIHQLFAKAKAMRDQLN